MDARAAQRGTVMKSLNDTHPCCRRRLKRWRGDRFDLRLPWTGKRGCKGSSSISLSSRSEVDGVAAWLDLKEADSDEGRVTVSLVGELGKDL